MTHTRTTLFKVTFVTVPLIIIAILIQVNHRRQLGDRYVHSPEVEKIGNDLESIKSMPHADYNQLSRISGKITEGGSPTADDINIVVDLCEKYKSTAPLEHHAKLQALMTMRIMASKLRSEKVPDNVYNRFFNASTSLLSDQAWIVRQLGAEILGILNDKRAIPALLPYQSDPDPRVRRSVRFGLKMLGVKME